MAEINVLINGRSYGMACDDGQEQRVQDLAKYVDARLKEIAKSGAAGTESHLLVLTALVMADEIFDLRDGMRASESQDSSGIRLSEDEEGDLVSAIDHLAARIDSIAGNLQKL